MNSTYHLCNIFLPQEICRGCDLRSHTDCSPLHILSASVLCYYLDRVLSVAQMCVSGSAWSGKSPLTSRSVAIDTILNGGSSSFKWPSKLADQGFILTWDGEPLNIGARKYIDIWKVAKWIHQGNCCHDSTGGVDASLMAQIWISLWWYCSPAISHIALPQTVQPLCVPNTSQRIYQFVLHSFAPIFCQEIRRQCELSEP